MSEFRLAILLLSTSMILSVSTADGEVEFDKFKPKMALDIGHIVRGKNFNNEIEFLPLNRNTVFLEQEGRYGNSWEFNVGLMGVIWWPFSVTASTPAARTIRVESRLSQAKMRLNFGSGNGRTFLDLGYFPYKYNSDAKNLGEYL